MMSRIPIQAERALTFEASRVKKRSVVIDGHKTSLSLEDEFWALLLVMADSRKTSIAAIVGKIDADRTHKGLSSACRLAVLKFSVSGNCP